MTKHGIWVIDNKKEVKLLRKKVIDFDLAVSKDMVKGSMVF